VTNLLELHTRFLYRFFFDHWAVQRACATLESVTVPRRDGSPVLLWEPAKPHVLYREELLDHVVRFLFDRPLPTDPPGCGYLRLVDPIANRWFGRVETQIHGGTTVRLRSSTPAQTELFLSDYGVGVLSIALALERDALTMETAAAFNYSLSQMRERTETPLYIPHPAMDPNARVLPEQAVRILPAPPPEAPIGERMGRPGGVFTLREVADELLRPLAGLGLEGAHDQLSVYTVARFDGGVDFDDPQARASLGPFLSMLAQVEEPSHAGASTGALGIENALLNRKHWAGVGLLGAAHLIADQDPVDHPFNQARLPRVFLKYFVPYLLAALQQLTLRSIIREASTIALAEDPRADGAAAGNEVDTLVAGAQATNKIRMRLLEFGVRGHFAQVSSREVLHRTYRTAQEGLSVPAVLSEARQALSDIDAKQTADRQVELTGATASHVKATIRLQGQMAEHLRIVARVQETVEVIEMFIVSVYAATLFDLLSKSAKALPEELAPLDKYPLLRPLIHAVSGRLNWLGWLERYHTIGVAGFALAGFLAAFLVIRLRKDTDNRANEHAERGRARHRSRA
jgi:hypothetical protein